MNRFVPNPLFEEQLKRSDILLPDLEEIAGDIADNARQIAQAEAFDTGDFADGIEAEAGKDHEGAMARVNANDWKSGFYEFGTRNNATVAPLRRGAEMAGHRVSK